MTHKTRLWMRHEIEPTERRAPIAPADARLLIEERIAVTVEDSPQRIFSSSDYAAVGCRIVEPGSWPHAPEDEYIIGLKEPQREPIALKHQHIFFGHAYKGQRGALQLLHRFSAGGGSLLDLEFLTDDEGHRVAAFGFWAGYVGAALAVLHSRGQLIRPLRPLAKRTLDSMLGQSQGEGSRALVIGALGRSGRGACTALAAAGSTVTYWDIAETRQLDLAALLSHGILINAILVTGPGRAFLTPGDLSYPARRLTVVCDVTCDVTSACNRLPIYDTTTDWQQPARRIHQGPPPLDIIAIDNLPSLVPLEASVAFSADLLPYLKLLGGPERSWQRCLRLFHAACSKEAARMEAADV